MVGRGLAGGGGAWRAGLWFRSDGAQNKTVYTKPDQTRQPCSRFLKPFSRSSFLCFYIFFFSFADRRETTRRYSHAEQQ